MTEEIEELYQDLATEHAKNNLYGNITVIVNQKAYDAYSYYLDQRYDQKRDSAGFDLDKYNIELHSHMGIITIKCESSHKDSEDSKIQLAKYKGALEFYASARYNGYQASATEDSGQKAREALK